MRIDGPIANPPPNHDRPSHTGEQEDRLVTAAVPKGERERLSRWPVRPPADFTVEAALRARELVARHSHFRGRADKLQFLQQDDVLVVRGCVPSFYLKQLLQTVLKQLDGIRSIDNQGEVVACDGLSSVRND